MTLLKTILIGCVLAGASLTLLSQTAKTAAIPVQKPGAVHAVKALDGQKIFEQNCSRCHNAPEGFSPNISGTVVRHMRVRANLSRAEEQALLLFFNP